MGRHGAGFEQKNMAYSQTSPFSSQSFSHTRGISRDNDTEMAMWKLPIFGITGQRVQIDMILSSHYMDRLNFLLLAPQWGMTASKGNEDTESPYGNAEVPLFEPQYGMRASKGVEQLQSTYGEG